MRKKADFTKDGPQICPICKRKCVIVPDNLVAEGFIYVHRAKELSDGSFHLISCCLSSDSRDVPDLLEVKE
jgi:hypothetical protein